MFSQKQKVFQYQSFLWVTLCFFVFLYVPVGIVIFFSFNENIIVSQWTGFSFKWFITAFHNERLVNSLHVSLTIAFFSTVIAVSISVLSALILERGKNLKYKHFSETIINLPLMVPEIVLAVSVLILFSQLGLRNSMIKLIIAHSTFCIPFAFLPIRARLQGMDSNLEQAAQDLYANRWITFKRITLPLLMPGVFAGTMLSFVISMDDFITSVMVSGGGATTLPVYIFSLVKMGITPELNAISTLVIMASILVVTPALFFLHQKNNRVIL